MAEVRRPERFRILIIGRANAGKTTILRAVCGVDEEPEVYDQEGNKVTPVVDPEEVPKVEEAAFETHAAHDLGEAVSEAPKTHHPEEVVSGASEAHPVHGEENQATPVSIRSAFRSAWRSIGARLLCRAPDSVLKTHLGEPEELNSAVFSPPRRAPGSILAIHSEVPEELSLAPSPPPCGEPKSILSPSSLRGEHCIDYELRFPSNPGFVFHDSRGFESGAVEELELVRKFIQEQANLGSVSKQLHAIWYCFPADSNRLMTAAEEEFFKKIDTGRVPVIAVFTKFDALDSAAFTALSGPGVSFEEAKAMAPKHATEKFNAEYLPLVESLAHPPKAVVCLRNMHNRTSPAVIQKAVSELVEKTEAALDTDALRVLLVQAQRVNVELCMKAAVNSGVIIKAAQDAVQADPMTFNPLQEELIRDIFKWFPSIWNESNLMEEQEAFVRTFAKAFEAFERLEREEDRLETFARARERAYKAREARFAKGHADGVARAANAFIVYLPPWFSSFAPSMAPPLQVLFVGITAVIIAADSFWPSFGNSGGHLIAASVVRYFQSNRGDLVRMAILEALPHDEPYAHLDEVSLEQIALNSHLAFARPESIFLLNSVA